jgi:hypothetical protein
MIRSLSFLSPGNFPGVLSRGRLQAGLSAGRPPHLDLMGPLVFEGDWRTDDFSC